MVKLNMHKYLEHSVRIFVLGSHIDICICLGPPRIEDVTLKFKGGEKGDQNLLFFIYTFQFLINKNYLF